jgi:hypothetical protein
LRRWVDASKALTTFHELMIVPAQQLGRLDCRLVDESPTFLVEAENADRALAFQEHLTLAYLWVLGGYELVRVVDQRYRDDPALAPEALRTRAKHVKKAFERVRIPLAKCEPSRVHRQTDSSFAWPAYHREQGVAWQVAPETFVSRAELAEALRDLAEAMPGGAG